MRFTLLLLMISALLFLSGCQKATTTKLETKNTPPANANQKSADPAHDAPRIALEDAKKDFDDGKALFVDTRAEVAYKQEHIKGAINIPAEAMEMRYKEIPTDKKIIAYCS
ncbi:MAG: rhodanese-like domain-containing protein [Pyrinomonadaceae bacterium]